MRDLDETDPTFVAELVASDAPVRRVARWLESRGHTVVVRPQRIRPTAPEWRAYSDKGDLEVRLYGVGAWERFEVTHRPALRFRDRASFEYRDGIIVNPCQKLDRLGATPYAFVYLNGPQTHAAIVMGATRPLWRKVLINDRAKGRRRSNYVCPLEAVKFLAL